MALAQRSDAWVEGIMRVLGVWKDLEQMSDVVWILFAVS